MRKNFRKWWNSLEYWKRGGIIGGVVGLILILFITITTYFQLYQWKEIPFFGKFLTYFGFILLIPAMIIGVLFWCEYTPGSFPPCLIITMIFSILVYALIGALIGLIIDKIRRRHNE